MRIVFVVCLWLGGLWASGTSVDLALVQKEFLGKWRIVAVEIDGFLLEGVARRAYVGFEKGRFGGFVGCNRFFGEYEVMEQNQLTLLPKGAGKKSCTEERLSIEAKFLRYFYGAFEVARVGKYLVLENAKMVLWLREFGE